LTAEKAYIFQQKFIFNSLDKAASRYKIVKVVENINFFKVKGVF